MWLTILLTFSDASLVDITVSKYDFRQLTNNNDYADEFFMMQSSYHTAPELLELQDKIYINLIGVIFLFQWQTQYTFDHNPLYRPSIRCTTDEVVYDVNCIRSSMFPT